MTKLQAKIINDYFYRWYEIPQVINMDKREDMHLWYLKDDTDTYNIIKQIEEDLCLNRLECIRVFKERKEEENGKEEYKTDYIA